MIEVRMGNVLDSGAQTLINTVNCVGVMGKGLALEFRKRYPDMFEDYVARCRRGEVRLGEPYLFRPRVEQARLFSDDRRPWIVNFPTKGHWRARSRLADIARGLAYVREHYRQWEVESLAVPPLGCGNGGLRWEDVKPLITEHLGHLEIPVTIYIPHSYASPSSDE